MKEFNKLLEYRDYYEYDFECEVIRIKDGAAHDYFPSRPARESRREAPRIL